MSLRDNEMVDGPTPNFATWMTYKRITISIEIDISYLYQSIISLTSPMNTISGVMTKMVKVLETTAGGRFSGCRKMCCTTTTKN